MYIIYSVLGKRFATGPYDESEIYSQCNDLRYEGVYIEKIVLAADLENEMNGLNPAPAFFRLRPGSHRQVI